MFDTRVTIPVTRVFCALTEKREIDKINPVIDKNLSVSGRKAI